MEKTKLCRFNNHFLYLNYAFNPNKQEVEDLKNRYQRGKVGDVEVKQKLATAINAFLEPFRARRKKYENQPGIIEKIINEGSRKARLEAQKTLSDVLKAMGLV